jgi:hypothetical protein
MCFEEGWRVPSETIKRAIILESGIGDICMG